MNHIEQECFDSDGGDPIMSDDFAADQTMWQPFHERDMSGGVSTEALFCELPPMVRVLMMTDGTVSKTIEAYYREKIAVDLVTQQLTTTRAPVDLLDVGIGEEVLQRRVRLRGTQSQIVYVDAYSMSRMDALPQSLRGGLVAGALGIGELLCSSRLETYRELVKVGCVQQHHGDQLRAWRTYRIYAGSRPAIAILENFPCRSFLHAEEVLRRTTRQTTE